jgi:hypothetical protein
LPLLKHPVTLTDPAAESFFSGAGALCWATIVRDNATTKAKAISNTDLAFIGPPDCQIYGEGVYRKFCNAA